MSDLMPMDLMEEAAPLAPAQEEAPPQQMEQPRDERGQFAPKDGTPKGQPSQEAARRREAQERDEARRERDDFKNKYDTLEKRFNDILTAARGEEEQKPADPLEEIKGTLGTIQQRFEQQDQQAQNDQVWQQVRQFADQDEREFTAKTPDFPEAARHYINSRINELGAIGYDQAQIEQQLRAEAEALLISCAQRQISPAEGMYKMAQARGYAPNAQPVIPQPQPRQQQNFGGRSFGTGQGAAGNSVTAAQLAAMSDEDYIAFRNTPEGKRAIRAAQGGM